MSDTRAAATRRLLLVNQFAVKLGFNLLMPFLADHLARDLGCPAWAVGLILGLRNVGQRGLCLVGGAMADRFGCKPPIVAGCAMRTGAFALLGWATDLPVLMIASTLTGFAGALFDPGVRAYLAAEADTERGTGVAAAFGRFTAAGQAGLLIGPIVGAALVQVGFQLAAVTAGGVFALLTVLQAWRLPAVRPAATARVRDRGFLADRRFLALCAVMSIAYVLSFQVYTTIPLALGETGMTWIFMLSAVAGIAAQPVVSALRLPPARGLVVALALSGSAFAPMLVGPRGAPFTAVLLAVATCLVGTYEMDLIVRMARGRRVATHYGLYATASGVATAAGSCLTGWLWDAGSPRLVWLVLHTAGLLAACGLTVLLPRLDRQ
ncbi:MFS transporter [Streptosporangiaceae bacterium NEAU-GS5]|nr:MFS transporter [Streptosporangiaceae bacterium NEAU-GS5]